MFYIQHVDRGTFLGTDRSFMYNQHNCGYHCPIAGHLEVSTTTSREVKTKWRFHSGVLFLVKREGSDDIDLDL